MPTEFDNDVTVQVSYHSLPAVEFVLPGSVLNAARKGLFQAQSTIAFLYSKKLSVEEAEKMLLWSWSNFKINEVGYALEEVVLVK